MTTTFVIDIAAIRAAAERIAPHVHRTPLLSSRTLGERAGVALHLKCELFQKTGSFKPRGALNRVLCLSDAERARGLVTVSAGNHAAAVAWVAQVVGAPCAVVMPSDAPRAKIDAVKGYGAEVIAHDDRDTLFDRLEQEQAKRGATFIHPFDHPDGLAGAGTVGLEILEQLPAVEWVLVPAGGGGLMGGVASAIKAVAPQVRVVAVELEAGPGFGPALAAGKPVPVSRPHGTLADGLTPPFVGKLPLEIAKTCVDQIVVVSEEEIRSAMRWLFARAKLVAEGAGAAATAALLAQRVRPPRGARVVSIVSGGNVDPARMADVLTTGGTE
jgi:threonine dehydratase